MSGIDRDVVLACGVVIAAMLLPGIVEWLLG